MSTLTCAIENFICGNLTIACRYAKELTLTDIQRELIDAYGYSYTKAVLTASYLKTGEGFIDACYAE